MLRVVQVKGPVLTIEMRTYVAEEAAIKQYERMKKDSNMCKKRLLIRASDKSETFLEVQNIKKMDVIKYSDVSPFLQIPEGM